MRYVWMCSGARSSSANGAIAALAAPVDAIRGMAFNVGTERNNRTVAEIAQVVVDAVSERMLRYDTVGELDFHDDFGWLDITHGITYANATRWHGAVAPCPSSADRPITCLCASCSSTCPARSRRSSS